MFSLVKNKPKAPIDMLNGPILPTIIKLAVPIVFSGLMAIMFNAADKMVAGKFISDSALAAVSACYLPGELLSGIIRNLSTGADIHCAHVFGSKDEKQIEKAVHSAMTFAIISGLLITVLRFIFNNAMLKLTNVPDSIFGSASLYMTITALGVFPSCIYQYAVSILRLNGDVKRPAIYSLISGAVNLILNLVFVIAFGLGIAGVAWATFISTLLSAALCIRALMKTEGPSRLIIKKLRIDAKALKTILRIGIPAALRIFLFTIASFFVESAMNSFNNDLILSGHGAAGSLDSFIRLIPAAVYSSTIVIIGQNYGARNYKRLVKAQRCGLLTIFVTVTVPILIVLLNADALLKLFISSPEAIHYGVIRLVVISTVTFLDVMSDLLASTLQNCKYSVTPTLISFLCVCVVRVVWVFTVFRMYPSYLTLVFCYPVSYFLSFAVMGIANIIVLRKVKQRFAAEREPVLQ